MRRLFALGLFPLLMTHAGSPPAEVALDVETPTRVTLHLDDVPADKAAEALAEKGRVRIQPATTEGFLGLKGRRVTLHADDQPFLTVLKDLGRQAGYDPSSPPASSTAEPLVLLVPRAAGAEARRPGVAPSWTAAPAVVIGPLMVVATQATRGGSVDTLRLGKRLPPPEPDRVGGQTQLSLMVWADPKVQVNGFTPILELESATDEQGRSLMLPRTAYQSLLPAGALPAQRTWTVLAPLSVPEGAKRIAELTGRVRVVVLSKVARFELAEVLRNREPVEQRQAGLRCRLGPVTEMHDCYKAKAGVFREGLSDTEWRDVQLLLTRPQTAPRMLDGAGRALATRVNNGPVAAAKDLAEVELCFWREPREGPSAPGEPRKLVWDVPLEAREVTFPVTFKDLPLP